MTFKDVVVTFTQEEWELLDLPQRTLYWRVMRETCGLLLSLGKASPHLHVGACSLLGSFLSPEARLVEKGSEWLAVLPTSPTVCWAHLLLPTLLLSPPGITRQET